MLINSVFSSIMVLITFLGIFHNQTRMVVEKLISGFSYSDLKRNQEDQFADSISGRTHIAPADTKVSSDPSSNVVTSTSTSTTTSNDLDHLDQQSDLADYKSFLKEKDIEALKAHIKMQLEKRELLSKQTTAPAKVVTTTPKTTIDKASELIELIEYMERKRQSISLEIPTTTLSMNIFQYETKQTESANNPQLSVDNYPDIDNKESTNEYWKFSIDLNQGYAISVYAVMAVLSVCFILTIVYYVHKTVKSMLQRMFTYPPCELKKPDIFTEGKDVDQWLKEFERYADATMSKNPVKKGNCLLLFLDDKSRSQLTQYNSIRHSKIEYGVLKDCMYLLFKTKHKSSRQYMQLFFARQQAVDETIPKYYTELCELVVKAFPTTPANIREEYVFQQLANGVSNVVLRNELVMEYENKSKLRDILERYSKAELANSINNQANKLQDSTTGVNIKITNNAVTTPNLQSNDSLKVANVVTVQPQPVNNAENNRNINFNRIDIPNESDNEPLLGNTLIKIFVKRVFIN